MSQLPTERSSLFDDLFRDWAPGFYIRPLHGDPLPRQIKLDVKESAEQFTIVAELPGVAKEDIQVHVDGPMVTLRAEVRQHDRSTQDERVLRSERYVGAVSRSLQLPADVDDARASAKYDQGVLTLTLPKKADSASSRRVRID